MLIFFSFSDIIYATNGTEKITDKNINITGTIISDSIEIDEESVNFNIANKLLNYANISGNILESGINPTFSDLQVFLADMDNNEIITAYNCL